MEYDEVKGNSVLFCLEKKCRKPRLIFGPWSKHDTNELISLYGDNPILWDTSLEGYRDIHKKNKIIDEIALSIKKDPQDVRTKWQNLKCQLNDEVRKMKTRSGQGAGENFVSRWEYFNAMQFVSKGEIQITTTSNVVCLTTCIYFNDILKYFF